MTNLSFLSEWRKRIYNTLIIGGKIKTLIVNSEDLVKYENALAEFSSGIVPIKKDGLLRYKNIPLGVSDLLKPGECELEIYYEQIQRP